MPGTAGKAPGATNKQTNNQTNKQPNKQTNKQTNASTQRTQRTVTHIYGATATHMHS